MKSTAAAACLVALVGADVSDDWMDWGCPGFPCSIVNYFDTRSKPNHTDFRQACTPLSTMYECSLLIKGENFAADNGDHTIAGWHSSTKPHPCKNPWGPCEQLGCLQGTNAKCKALCDRLDLIFPYHDRCYKICDKSCTDTDESFSCSECEVHGYGADQCGCGYCGSFGGCGFTCGKDPNQAPLGPKCFNLPPSPSPTPVLPPTPAPGYITAPPETTTPPPTPSPTPAALQCSECEAHGYGADQCGCGYCGSYGGCGFTCGKDQNQAPLGPKCVNAPPTPSPTPSPAPTQILPPGGCCSWAEAGEEDECGESTAWCKASRSNCEACDGHWACLGGPCPAPAPTPIPARGCCSWAEPGQTETCGESTSWCKASSGNCRTCNGHWVYPKHIDDVIV